VGNPATPTTPAKHATPKRYKDAIPEDASKSKSPKVKRAKYSPAMPDATSVTDSEGEAQLQQALKLSEAEARAKEQEAAHAMEATEQEVSVPHALGRDSPLQAADVREDVQSIAATEYDYEEATKAAELTSTTGEEANEPAPQAGEAFCPDTVSFD